MVVLCSQGGELFYLEILPKNALGIFITPMVMVVAVVVQGMAGVEEVEGVEEIGVVRRLSRNMIATHGPPDGKKGDMVSKQATL